MSLEDRCSYCWWGGGKHDPHCPTSKPRTAPEWTQYNEGWNDGRAGKDSASDNPVYNLGYGKGYVALEAAENGHDSRFDE